MLIVVIVKLGCKKSNQTALSGGIWGQVYPRHLMNAGKTSLFPNDLNSFLAYIWIFKAFHLEVESCKPRSHELLFVLKIP